MDRFYWGKNIKRENVGERAMVQVRKKKKEEMLENNSEKEKMAKETS